MNKNTYDFNGYPLKNGKKIYKIELFLKLTFLIQ